MSDCKLKFGESVQKGLKTYTAGYSDGKLSFRQEIEPFSFTIYDIS